MVRVNCKNLYKSFQNGERRLEILHNINLQIKAGEMVMLMGPSGSGKSTLLAIIGGILQEDSGSCFVLDRAINELSEAEKTIFRGKNIGFMFQHFMLVPTLSCIENAAIGLLCQGYARREALEKAGQFLTEIGLQDQLHKKPRNISGGEQQRVAIARAFLHEPSLLLCDEPTSFLDLARGKQVMDMLQERKKQSGCSIIVVTHDPRIIAYGDRVVRIEDGSIIEDARDKKGT